MGRTTGHEDTIKHAQGTAAGQMGCLVFFFFFFLFSLLFWCSFRLPTFPHQQAGMSRSRSEPGLVSNLREALEGTDGDRDVAGRCRQPGGPGAGPVSPARRRCPRVPLTGAVVPSWVSALGPELGHPSFLEGWRVWASTGAAFGLNVRISVVFPREGGWRPPRHTLLLGVSLASRGLLRSCSPRGTPTEPCAAASTSSG